VAGRWFSLNTPVYSTNKIDSHDIIEILLKVALNTITLTPTPNKSVSHDIHVAENDDEHHYGST
jgi:hypothetical protein